MYLSSLIFSILIAFGLGLMAGLNGRKIIKDGQLLKQWQIMKVSKN